MKKNILGKLVTMLIVVCFLAACQNAKPSEDTQVAGEVSASGKEVFEMPKTLHASLKTEVPQAVPDIIYDPIFIERDITLMAVGDNLLHMGIVNTGKMPDGTYDYSFLFQGIAEFLEVADIKVINQETILGGNELGFSGYPRFNSPTEVGDAIAAAGFNVVLHASNHSADKGLEGLLNCVAFWENYPEVVMTGIYEEAAETHDIPILTIDGVDFALLNYTYSPNSETIPADVRGHLDMLCDWNRDTGRLDFTELDSKVLTDIEAASEIADVVIVFPHWGNEYMTKPSSYQKKFAEQMTQAGADLIVGTHPHVVQPVEWVESENGNRALCYYSLGNYVSTQKGGPSMLEGLAWVTFRVKEDGVVISEEKTGIIPMVCHYTHSPTRLGDVYLLEEYTEELAAKHGIHSYGGVNLTLSDLQQWSEEILGDWVITANEALAHG